MSTQVFDWEHAKTCNSPEMYAFLKAVHNTPLTEEMFVPMFQSVPLNGIHRSQRRGPSKARIQYRKLKEKFGFFV